MECETCLNKAIVNDDGVLGTVLVILCTDWMNNRDKPQNMMWKLKTFLPFKSVPAWFLYECVD